MLGGGGQLLNLGTLVGCLGSSDENGGGSESRGEYGGTEGRRKGKSRKSMMGRKYAEGCSKAEGVWQAREDDPLTNSVGLVTELAYPVLSFLG